jgi:hypothetical protein
MTADSVQDLEFLLQHLHFRPSHSLRLRAGAPFAPVGVRERVAVALAGVAAVTFLAIMIFGFWATLVRVGRW